LDRGLCEKKTTSLRLSGKTALQKSKALEKKLPIDDFVCPQKKTSQKKKLVPRNKMADFW